MDFRIKEPARIIGLLILTVLMVFSVPSDGGQGLTAKPVIETPSPEDKEIKNVLVVNSYHPGYEWSDDIMQGIQSVLGDNNFNVSIEYLDSKKYSDEIYYKYLEEIIRYKYSNAKIDAIIVSDHHAFYLMLEMRKTFHADVPLVFCGIDRIDPEDLADYKPIYGILEGDSGIRSTLDLILSIHPGIHKIFFVADQTTSAGVMLKHVRDYEPSYKKIVTFDYLINMSTDELKEALKKVPQNSVVMWLHFIKDKNEKVLSVTESQTYVASNASVPVYVCYGFSAGTGIVGGSIIRGFDQGEKAGKIAMQLLKKESIVPIQFSRQSTFKNVFDYKVMKRFNIGIKDIPEHSIIYNKPFSVYGEYRWHIIGIIIFMFAQTSLIALMLINQKKRKQAEETIRESHDYLKNLTDSMPDAIFSVKLPERIIEWANDTFRTLGYEPDECVGRTTDFLYPSRDEFIAFGDKMARAIADGQEVLLAEQNLVNKSGDVFPAEITLSFFKTKGDVVRITVIGRNIAERKRKEQKLQEYQHRLKSLVSQLTIAEEGERRRIAADLHDHVGQSLALARMQIAAAKKSADAPGLAAKLNDISETLREAVHDTRHLMFDLSSPTMHEIGLGAAISEWLEEQIEKRHEIKTKFFDDIVDRHKIALDENVRAILFRNVRELLTNVVKHAQANQVTVSMEITDGVLKIILQDDGVGFEYLLVSQTGGPKGGFGLFSIRERMTDLGGALEIKSEPGKGCTAILSVPLGNSLESGS